MLWSCCTKGVISVKAVYTKGINSFLYFFYKTLESYVTSSFIMKGKR